MRARFLKVGREYYSDIIFLSLLLAISLYLMAPLFNWGAKALDSDTLSEWALFYWLKESLFSFHQLPSWSPLWMGGVPFFGMNPPGVLFSVIPLYAITGDIPAAYNLGAIFWFSLAGISMYFYLKYLSHNSLAAFLGAFLYLILPVHSYSMLFWGHYTFLAPYAVVPLVLLFTERYLDKRNGIDLIMCSIFLALVLLSQIEYSFIFLWFFYLPYLIFTLFLRRIGIRQLIHLAASHKVGVLIALLILLIPLAFYVPVLTQQVLTAQGNFSTLTNLDIESGIHHWTFKHFSDPFVRQATNYLDGYYEPATEYYLGPLSFIILLASILLAAVVRDKKQAVQILFFAVATLAYLFLSMGVYGQLFAGLRSIISPLAELRVPLRFNYLTAVSLSIIFALSFAGFSKLVKDIPRFSRRMVAGMPLLLPLALVIALLADFHNYFSFYQQRLVDRQEVNQIVPFLEEKVLEPGNSENNIVRVHIYPILGINIDRVSQFKRTEEGQSALEITQSWLPWNQYRDATDYYLSVVASIDRDKDSLDFFSNLLSLDYILVYFNKTPPSFVGVGDEYLQRKKEMLDSLSGDDPQPLRYKGNITTKYYEAYLYEVKNVSGKVRFYPANQSLVMINDNLYVSQMLQQVYSHFAGDISSGYFLSKVVAISAEKEYLKAVFPDAVVVEGFHHYGNSTLFLGQGSSSLIMEAEDLTPQGWAEKGWTRMVREEISGAPNYGDDAGIGDVTQVEDNYLERSFKVKKGGDYILDVYYFSFVDTGKLDVYLDDKFVGSVDTYSPTVAKKDYLAEVALDAGWHKMRLVGKENDRGITTGAKGRWVEVDQVVLLNKEELPQMLEGSVSILNRITEALNASEGNHPQANSAEITRFQLTPGGISLEADVQEEGVLSAAYYYNPWWRVYVDGKEREALKVDGIFIGAYVERGKHRIEFVYDYPSLNNVIARLWRQIGSQ